MLTPAGNQLTEPVELTARVTTLAGLGRVFTVGALLVLASWWFSYFRRRRKTERQALLEATRTRHPALSDNEQSERHDHEHDHDAELSSTTSPDADAAAMRQPATPADTE